MGVLGIFFEPAFWLIRILFVQLLYFELAKGGYPVFGVLIPCGLCWGVAGLLMHGIRYGQGRNKVYLAMSLDLLVAGFLTYWLPVPEIPFSFLLPFLDATARESALLFSLAFAGIVEVLFVSALRSIAPPSFHVIYLRALSVLFSLLLARYVLGYYQQLRRSNTFFSLIAIGQSIGPGLNMDHVVENLEDVLATLYHYKAFVLYLVEGSERMARVKFNRSPLPSAFVDFSVDRESVCSKVLKTGEGIFVPDLHALRDPLLPALKSFRSAAILPLQSHPESPFGFFILIAPFVNYFSEEDLRILQTFSNQAAATIRNVMLHEQTTSLAISDSLTGLYTHGHFQTMINEVVPRQLNLNKPVSVIMVDLDNFKEINDTYGHPVGDHVVVHCARTVRSMLTSQDIFARYGGDEFIALIADANKLTAGSVAERIRKSVENLRFPMISPNLKTSASIGVASAPEDAASAAELIEAADKALYLAKQGGRNRIALAGQQEAPSP